MSTLPKGWARTTLEDLVRPKSERVSPTTQPDAPYIGLEHVQAHTNVILGTVPASNMTSSSASFYAGDILYGRMRPYLNKVVRPTFSGLASAEFIILPKSEAVDPYFLLKRLSSIDFVEFACSQYEGDRPRVKFDALGKFQIDLPPIPEQTRIVTKLEELLTDLDAGVAELKTAQKKLAKYRQSMLKAAVEGALTAQWRVENPTSESGAQLLDRILQERRACWEAKQLAKFAEEGKTPPKEWQKKYPEPVQPYTTDLPKLPEGWVWASVDQLSESIRNGISKTPNTENRGFPIFRINAVRPMNVSFETVKYIDVSESYAADYRVEEGDVLVTRYNGSVDLLGVFGMVKEVPEPTLYPDKLIRMRPVRGVELGAWMEVCGNVGTSRKYLVSRAKTTSGQTGISGADLKKTPIPLAPEFEQRIALSVLKEQLETIQELINPTELALKQSAAQRQNILRAAFAGQLVPQAPNDEPASVLLERIRAQRMEQTKQPKPRKTKKQESTTVTRKLVDVLTEAGDWLPAQEVFRRCGIADGAQTEEIEALYAELRALDKRQHLSVKAVFDLVDTPEGKKHRKVADHLKWVG